MNKYFASYFTKNFSCASKIFLKSLQRVRVDENIKLFKPYDLSEDFKKKFSQHLKIKKGGGLWCWKFFIIKSFFDNSKNDDILFYSDIAVTFIKNPFFVLNDLINTNPFLLFSYNSIERQLNKLESFQFFDIDINSNHAKSNQCYGTNFMIRNCHKSKLFFLEAENIFANYHLASDVNVNSIAQHPDFLFHRHDQSIISLLAKKNNYEFFSDISQYGNLKIQSMNDHYLNNDSKELPQIVFHTRKKNDFF